VRLERGVVPSGSELRLGNTLLRLEEGMAVDPRTATDQPALVEELVGDSTAMQQIRNQVTRLASVEASTLILGETGTGKEVVAHAIHRLGQRSGGPFEIMDCGSLPVTLIASELFGHERRLDAGRAQNSKGGTCRTCAPRTTPSSSRPAPPRAGC
jgi:DNA-binding NtrC family response regulator